MGARARVALVLPRDRAQVLVRLRALGHVRAGYLLELLGQPVRPPAAGRADNNTDWVHGLRGRCVAEVIVRPGGEPCVWWCRCPCSKDAAEPAAQPVPDPVPDDAEGVAPAPEAALNAGVPEVRGRQQTLF